MTRSEILAECEAAQEYYLDMDPEEAEAAFICEVAGFIAACARRGDRVGEVGDRLGRFDAAVSKVVRIIAMARSGN